MKKYFLKGKEYLAKKLQQLEIETQSIDYVAEQIPNRIKQPLASLMTDEIDLEPTSLYEAYFQNYPTHHLSQFLYEKYNMQVEAKIKPPPYHHPKQQCFIPNIHQQLEQKALLLREMIEDYDEGYAQMDSTVLMMCVIHFHHKRGTQIQYVYPKAHDTAIEEMVVHHAMPDSSHNKSEDYNFFNFEVPLHNKKRMLFGVSYFKQIKVTEQMRKRNPQITRSYVQKAVAVVSTLPLFGYLKFRLAITTKLFFDNFNNFEIIDAAYAEINKSLTQTWPKMTINELYIGTDLKVIIDLFGAYQFYQIWKAVLYQRRVVVYAHSSSSASSFILSLISLFPGLSTFGIFSKPISRYMQGLREYDLPLRLFSSQNFMWMSFHIQDFHNLSRFQKSSTGHFLIGTTNRLLKEANDYGIELLVNLQNCTLEKKKARITWQSTSKTQKVFITQLENIVSQQANLGYSGSQDSIRNHFHQFLKNQLVEIIEAIQLFKQFINESNSYSSQHQVKQSNELIQQSQHQSTKNKYDFPPLIPKEVVNMPLPYLLQAKSFTHFLQFHNKNIINNNHPSLKVDNYDYLLKISSNQFIFYNIIQHRLCFGKGTIDNFQGKEIKFIGNEKEQLTAKSIFIGIMINNKYQKNGYYVDGNEVYQGDYLEGTKHGYGKLQNQLHKYIGYFENNLYSGQGQLVTGSNVYVGEFREGMRHGCGKNQGPQLNYDGEWLNDYPNGHGILSSNNQQYIGNFEKGKLCEDTQVTIRYQDGHMYKGIVKNKIPNGKGMMVYGNGEIMQGEFINGQYVKSAMVGGEN